MVYVLVAIAVIAAFVAGALEGLSVSVKLLARNRRMC